MRFSGSETVTHFSSSSKFCWEQWQARAGTCARFLAFRFADHARSRQQNFASFSRSRQARPGAALPDPFPAELFFWSAVLVHVQTPPGPARSVFPLIHAAGGSVSFSFSPGGQQERAAPAHRASVRPSSCFCQHHWYGCLNGSWARAHPRAFGSASRSENSYISWCHVSLACLCGARARRGPRSGVPALVFEILINFYFHYEMLAQLILFCIAAFAPVARRHRPLVIAS